MCTTDMPPPRPVFAGSFYMVTRRCTQRQFLLRPDQETNNGYVYCLGEAAARYGIEVVLTQMMSNHHHTVVYDPNGTINEFTEQFHKMFAKSQNVLRGRTENLWSNEPPSVVELIEPDDVLDKLVYVATNPVKDGLVEQVHHWPGVNAMRALANDEPLRAHRPRHFFRKDGVMPARIELRLKVPAQLGDREKLIQMLCARIAEVVAEQARTRRETGRRVVGRRRVLRQSPFASPESLSPTRNLRPRFAARNRGVRIAVLQLYREFQSAYRDARVAWLAGKPIPFPSGTYWLRRFANVPVATPELSPR
jgi:putative transposase